jgi:hypothetical protein
MKVLQGKIEQLRLRISGQIHMPPISLSVLFQIAGMTAPHLLQYFMLPNAIENFWQPHSKHFITINFSRLLYMHF